MWGYKSNDGMGQAAYRRYRLINKSGYPIDSMYVSQWSNVDVGDYTRDLVGCDSILNIGYAYNGEPNDIQFDPFGIPPPSIGYIMLQGPVTPSPGDTALFDFKKRADFRNLSMTSFGYFPSGGNNEWFEPEMNSYDGTLQWYNVLRGYTSTKDVLNPTPYTHRNTGVSTKFPLNGDPVTGIGDIDGQGNNFSPGARRMAICSGPFTMMDGDTQEVVIAIVGGLGIDYINSVEVMKANAEEVRNQYLGSLNNLNLPYNFTLWQNFPNPFNPTTTIRFSIEAAENVKLEIFNTLGQKVYTLLHWQMPAGRHQVIWNSRNDSGQKFGSGIYFYRISAGDYVQTRKMILLK
ncbi:MAG: T9SS type A sorting domain-containing protein [Calditrichae bacterium]|nr:T9SS type A sorting domain-containing protein [Calditrichia bacterium]